MINHLKKKLCFQSTRHWCHEFCGRTGNGSRPSLITKPSTRCVRTCVVSILSGLPGTLAGAEGGWLGPLTAAGRTGGGRGGGGGGGLLLLLLAVVVVVEEVEVVVVSCEGTSTCGDLITE